MPSSVETYLERIWKILGGTGGASGAEGISLDSSYAPIGAHSSGIAIAVATTLAKPAGASKIIIQALTQNVRFMLDGNPPTTTAGFQILAGGAPMIIEVPGASIRVIQEAATASLQYQWVS